MSHLHWHRGQELSEADQDDHIFINRYLQRAIAIDLIAYEEDEFVYVKFPFFILIGFLGEQNKENNWRGAEVLKKGEIKPSHYFIPAYFWDYIYDRCSDIVEMRQSYSDKQLSKIHNTMGKNPNRYYKSRTKIAVEKDLELFGIRAKIDRKR